MEKMTKEQLANMFDHTLLKPFATKEDFQRLCEDSKKYGFIITNPPYGERLEDKKDLPALYTTIGQVYRDLDAWSMYLITSYEEAERYIGRKADKNRKLYNGMIRTYFYQFMGPKPPKKKDRV